LVQVRHDIHRRQHYQHQLKGPRQEIVQSSFQAWLKECGQDKDEGPRRHYAWWNERHILGQITKVGARLQQGIEDAIQFQLAYRWWHPGTDTPVIDQAHTT